MAVSDVQGAPPGADTFKQVAPVAAATLGIIAAVVGGTMVASNMSAPDPASIPAETGVVAPQAAPPPGAQPVPGLPSVQFNQPTAGMPQMGIEILVKFKDDGKVKDIIDTFWKDAPASRAKFEAFKASHPAFANLKLDRVTYSNELVLVHAGDVAPAQRNAAMREIATKLNSVADISYAEPNMTAQAGGQ